MKSIYDVALYAINLIFLISVISLMGYALIKATNLRKPFRSNKQRKFLKWLIIALAFSVIQFSFRFVGDYQTEHITQITHHTANALMIIAGIGMIIAARELYTMKLTFKKKRRKKK